MASNDTHEILYAEHTEERSSWRSPRPDFDAAKFNRELERRGGCIGSVPRYRLRWGGELEECVIDEYADHTGYVFLEDGKQKFVSINDKDFEFPDNAVISPHYEYEKVYIPRWIVEKYTGDVTYEFAWTIERLEKVREKAGHIEMVSHYREPAEVDLEIAAGTTSLSESLKPSDISDAIARQKALEAKHKKDAREEIRQDMHHWANKYAKDGVPSPVFSIPLSPEIKNIPKESIAKL